jgi:predicted metal-dependent hydrolase
MSSPAYKIQVSPRAKYARLKVSAKDGVTVVIPKGFDQSRIPGILYKKRDWLRRVGERFDEQRKFLSPDPPGMAPERISLRVIGEEWAVDYRDTGSEKVSGIERESNRLLVVGDTENEQAMRDCLKRWLSRKSHQHLVPWTKRLAVEHRLKVERFTVKSQRTRWASCSAGRIISLNLRLLFLPERLVRYVLLHELAHTQLMNHSARFWAVVRDLEPDYEALDAELRTAWRFVPAWLGQIASGDL